MKIINKLAPENWVRTNWKNGLGQTVQLSIYPPGADFNEGDFSWRVSRAEINQSCPFSQFPAYKRALTQIQGGHIELVDLETRQRYPLRLFEPHYFSGHQSTHCHLRGEAATDINALVRQDQGTLKMTCFEFKSEKFFKVNSGARFMVLHAVQGAAALLIDGHSTDLMYQNTIIIENDALDSAIESLEVKIIDPSVPTRLIFTEIGRHLWEQSL